MPLSLLSRMSKLVFQKVDFFHRKWLLSFISYITFIATQYALFQWICTVSFLRYLNFNVILFPFFSYFLSELHCSYRKFRKKQTTYFWNLSTWHKDFTIISSRASDFSEANIFIVFIWKQHRSKIHTITEYLLSNRKQRIIPFQNTPGGADSMFWEFMQFPELRFAC